MSEGFEIPIGGDLSGLASAFDGIIAAVERLGDRMEAAMNRGAAASARAFGGLQKVQTGAAAAGASMNAVGSGATRAATSMGGLLGKASSVGAGLANIVAGASAARTAWGAFQRMAANGGAAAVLARLRGGITSIGSGLRAIAANPALRRLAMGAVAAVAGAVALRAAYLGASAVMGGLLATGRRVFSGILSGARATAASIKSLFAGAAGAAGGAGGGGGLRLPGLPIAGLLAGAGAVALLTTQLKGAMNAAARFETLQISVEHFTGSVQAAKDLLGDLASFAIKTPFETEDVQNVAGQLLGAGIRENVAGITKDLAALAADGQQLGELGDAMAKGFAKGKFQTEELNKFLERGINLMPALEQATGLAGESLTKAIEKGLRFDQVTAAIASMSAQGGQFFGLLERRSFSFVGLVSTLKGVWTDLRRELGQPILDALKPILEAGIARLGTLMEAAKKMGNSIGSAIGIAFQAIQSGRSMEFLGKGISFAFQTGIDILRRGVAGAIAFLGTALPPIMEAAFAKLSDPQFWQGIGKLLEAAAASFAAEIRAALGQKEMAAALRRQSDMAQMLGGALIERSGGVDFGATLSDSMVAGAQAFLAAISESEESPALADARKSFQDISGEFADAAAAAAAASKDRMAMKDGDGAAIASREGAGALIQSGAEAIQAAAAPVLSLSRVGGGGAGGGMDRMMAETRTQTRVLRDIRQALLNGPPRPAVYA
jgi:tape measure domain-containing protein